MRIKCGVEEIENWD